MKRSAQFLLLIAVFCLSINNLYAPPPPSEGGSTSPEGAPVTGLALLAAGAVIMGIKKKMPVRNREV